MIFHRRSRRLGEYFQAVDNISNLHKPGYCRVLAVVTGKVIGSAEADVQRFELRRSDYFSSRTLSSLL